MTARMRVGCPKCIRSAQVYAREGFDYQQNCRGIAAGIVIAEMKKGLAAINLLTLCVYGAAGRN
jgi:hypothetical protein